MPEDPLQGRWVEEGVYLLVSPFFKTERPSILSARDLGVHSYYVSRFVRNPTSLFLLVNLSWCPLDHEITLTSFSAAWQS